MTYNLTHDDILNMLPRRKRDSHKGNYGKILLLCGSVGYTGAAALAAMGALRVGAGLVYLCVPQSIYDIEATKLLEPIVMPLPERAGGLSADAWPQIRSLLPKMDAVLFGPGLGCGSDIAIIAENLLADFQGTVVLDADGINCFRNNIDILRGRSGPVVITPHEGEFARLTGRQCTDRINDAVAAARDIGAIVVLKGHRTVITNGEDIFINETGNPGMAVGGCGDVLAGMVAGLVGQGIDPLQASAMAAWLHGAAGDECAECMGEYGMLPSDMLSVIPRLMK